MRYTPEEGVLTTEMVFYSIDNTPTMWCCYSVLYNSNNVVRLTLLDIMKCPHPFIAIIMLLNIRVIYKMCTISHCVLYIIAIQLHEKRRQRKKKKAKRKYKSVTSDKYHINNMFITKKKYNIVVVVVA